MLLNYNICQLRRCTSWIQSGCTPHTLAATTSRAWPPMTRPAASGVLHHVLLAPGQETSCSR